MCACVLPCSAFLIYLWSPLRFLFSKARTPAQAHYGWTGIWKTMYRVIFLLVVSCLVCSAFDSFIFDAPFWPCKLFLVILCFYL